MSALFVLFSSLFLTSGFSQTTISFIQISDTHLGTETSLEKLQELLADTELPLRKPAFIINTGDITETGSVDEFNAYLNIIKTTDIPFYHVIGNHDVRWSNIGKRRFIEMLGPAYQSFDYQAIHVILLDSGVLLEHYGHFSQKQLDWLKQDLEKTGTEKPIIICAHHPIFTGERFIDNEVDLLEIIDDYNVLAYLCGHGHQNKKWQINGIDVIMTQALKSDQPGYRIFEILPEKKFSVFIRNITEKKTTLEYTRQINRHREKVDYYLRAPNIQKVYDDNLPILLTSGNLRFPEVCIDGLDWVPLQQKGSKFFQNIEIQHLIEGEHLLFLKYVSDAANEHIEFIPFKIERGKTAIQFKTDLGGAIQASPLADKDRIFIGNNDGLLYCLDATTGIPRWCFHAKDAITTTPADNGDTLFITANDGFCYAVDKKTGVEIWQQQCGQTIFSSPTYSQRCIYFGSSDSCLYALRSKDGTILWKSKTGGLIKAKPAVGMNKVVFGSWDGNFYCLSTEMGQVLWKNRVSDNFYYAAATSNPLIVIDKIFVSSHDHTLHAYDLNSGSVIWEHLKSNDCMPGYSSPLSFDDKIISGSISGHVCGFSEDMGGLLWTTSLADSADPIFDSSPTLNYPQVVVGSINGVLYAVDLNTGAKIWSRKLSNGFIFSTPIIQNDVVYVGSTDGNLYAIKINNNTLDCDSN